jgi:thioredoxin-related protein
MGLLYKSVLLFAALNVFSLSALAEGKELIPFPLEEAYQRAYSQDKLLLIAFLGDGWSVASEKFSTQTLESKEFCHFTRESIIYFPVIARKKPKLTKEETAILQSLVVYFDVKSYPQLILIGPDGNEILRHGYRDIKGESYVQLLKTLNP